jgi:hypothetical protein
LSSLYVRVSAPSFQGRVAAGTGRRDSLSLVQAFLFLFRGVQRGYFSFQTVRSEILKADELLISARGLPWRSRFPLAESRFDERIGDFASIPVPLYYIGLSSLMVYGAVFRRYRAWVCDYYGLASRRPVEGSQFRHHRFAREFPFRVAKDSQRLAATYGFSHLISWPSSLNLAPGPPPPAP